MASASRWPGRCDQIWSALMLLFLAASRRWQAATLGRLGSPDILLNKVRIWSSFAGTSPSTVPVKGCSRFCLDPWWRPVNRRSISCSSISWEVPLVRRHRYLLCLPPQVRGRFFGFDGGLFYLKWCWRASAALVHRLSLSFFSSSGAMVVIEVGVDRAGVVLWWLRSSRTRYSWSFFSATVDMVLKSLAKKGHFLPDLLSSNVSTSVGRPCWSSGVEGFAGPEASGSVPVFVHGCSVLSSELRSGKEEGLDCFFRSFSRVLSTIVRDPYVIYVLYGVLCNHFVLPLLM